MDKDDFVSRLKNLALVYFTEILGYCVMDNHFHILLRMFPAGHVSEEELRRRFRVRYGEKRLLPAGKSEDLRKKWSSLSEFSKELKESFSKAYNKRKDRRGYLWGDRFKSLTHNLPGPIVPHPLGLKELPAAAESL